jgi:PAS domain S-box-containing protein
MNKNISAFARKLLPVCILLTIASGVLIFLQQEMQLFNSAFGNAVSFIFLFSMLSLLLTGIINPLKNTKAHKDVELKSPGTGSNVTAKEVKYQNLIENSGVVIYTTTLDGYITFTSTKASQLTGYALPELDGMHFTKMVDSEWKQPVINKYKSQIKNSISETLMEFCMRTKNGESKWVEQSAVLIFENGIPSGFQCIVKEISERKQMEDVLRKYEVELVKNQARLQSILDNATSFIFIKDIEGQYLVINEKFRETFNVNDEDVLGKSAFDFAAPKNAKNFTDCDDKVKKTCGQVALEEIIEMEDGPHHFLIIQFPLLDAQNKIYGLSGIGTDITERVRYEEELIAAKKIAEDAKKLQEQFLANMSHEIRTPMNGIQGMTDLLLDTKLNDEQKDFAKTIKRSSDNLLVIINDILDFSKIQAGKLTIEKIDFKLDEVVDNVRAIFKYRVQDKGLGLRFSIDENIPSVLNGDPYRLNQILVNLIGNSIKFTHEGFIDMKITIQKKTSNESFLNFVISDTGIGIEKDKIDRIFESFTQASAETSRKYGGTGLGLAITKQLLEMQGGSITVESKINTGTIFRFSLPYRHPEINHLKDLAPKKTINKQILFHGKKFLVAEDNEVNQKVIRHVLKKAGGEIDIANNGLEAVALLEKDNSYDLIIMDLQMPEMDGYDATKYIRNVLNLSIPIVAMTASALKGEKLKCLEIGMNDYLSKPFDFNFLYKRLGIILGQSENSKKLIMSNEPSANQKLFDLSILEEMDDNEYISEILNVYLKNCPGELAELRQACNAKNYDFVFKMAHKIKGSTSLLKSDNLLRILAKMEEFAKAEISEGLAKLSEQANEEFGKLSVQLKDYLKILSSTTTEKI